MNGAADYSRSKWGMAMSSEEKEVQTREETDGLSFACDKGFFYSYNIIFELEISEHAKILYLYLCRRADGNNKTFPSYQTMASACSLSRSTAIRAMKELMAEGLLLRKHQQHGKEYTSNQYLLYPEPDEKAKQFNMAQMEKDREKFEQRSIIQSRTPSSEKKEDIEVKRSSEKNHVTKKKVKPEKKNFKTFSKRIGETGVSFSFPIAPLKGQLEIAEIDEKNEKEGWCQSDTRGSPAEHSL